MDCSLSSLIEASRCYRCIPGPVMKASAISLLCQWANNLTPPVTLFSYEPATNDIAWEDSGGSQTGNLAQFYAITSITGIGTVTEISFPAGPFPLTAIHNLSQLTGLQILSFTNHTFNTIDLSGCGSLLRISCGFGALTTIDFSPCPLLTQIYCNDNNFTVLDVRMLPFIQIFQCNDCLSLTTVWASGCAALNTLDCSAGAPVVDIWVVGCTSLVNFFYFNNPGVTVHV